MTTTVDTRNPTGQSSLESLVSAISMLTLKDKEKLIGIIEQQIFEKEEENYEEDAETATEIEKVRAEYEAGDYVTIDEYIASRVLQIP